MNENDSLTLYSLPSSAAIYEQLGREIDDLAPRVTQGSTLQTDLNELRVARRQLWMRRAGLGQL